MKKLKYNHDNTKIQTSAVPDSKLNNTVEKTHENPVLDEIWAIALFLISIFIFLSIRSPKSTGIAGYWLIEIFAKNALGICLKSLPFFLLIYALSFLFFHGRERWRLTLPALFSAYMSFTIVIEIFKNGSVNKLTWPIPINGGGIIGTLGLFSFQNIIGYNGTILLISGVFVISFLIIFNFSLQSFLQYLYLKQVIKNTIFNESGNPQISAKKSLLEKLILFLFYKKPNANSQEFAKKAKLTSTQKIEIVPDKTLETEAEIEDPEIKSQKSPVAKTRKNTTYNFPCLELLEKAKSKPKLTKERELEQKKQAELLEETLTSFGVSASLIGITPGPSVTRYELKPGVGVKISKFTTLSKDIALKLAVPDVRIEAPIPGKAAIGIEVPNQITDTVTLRTVLERKNFSDHKSKLLTALGLTISGDPVYMDLGSMPHVLVAGATGSGKSVCLNTIILSILFKSTPEEVKFLMIDPKKVELSMFEGIPHLLAPVVTDSLKAAATLKKWAILEMERRYELFSKIGVKNIEGFNNRIEDLNKLGETHPEEAQKKINAIISSFTNFFTEENPPDLTKKIPYIVVVIDELADLMMVASQDVESTICRLAQMARATGIHLVIATQRPSVNVITGLIKANIPSRISFFLQSQIDSRTILDMPGAEKLLGKGDMLYSPIGTFKPLRLQGVYISEKEIKKVIDFVKLQGQPNYVTEIIDVEPISNESMSSKNTGNSDDELFNEAKEIVMNTQYASTSYLQRKLRIGYNRAARLMDELEEKGIISKYDGEKKARIVTNVVE